MASKRVSTREELQMLRRADLQKLAKDYHIKANLKTNALIDEIMRVQQENQPSPKTGDSSLGSGSQSSPTRSAKPNVLQAMPSSRAGRSKLPGTARGRRIPSVDIIVPPGVAAANPDAKGKGRVRKPVYTAHKKGVPASRLPIAKTVSLEDVKADPEVNLIADPSGSSYELPSPDRPVPHSESSLIASLSSRVAKLEHARESSRERRKKNQEIMEAMDNKLQAARDSMDALTKRHDDLKASVDSKPTAAPIDVSDILQRLVKLEEHFSKLGVEKAASISSSDAEGGIPWEPAPQRSTFQTPPNRPDPRSRGSRFLGPAAILGPSVRRGEAPQTPPPQVGRYHANPDESPSPTRRPSSPSQVLSRPPAVAVPTAGSAAMFAGRATRISSAVEEGEALLYSEEVSDSPRRGRQIRKVRSGDFPDVVEDSDGPDEGKRKPSKRQRKTDSAEREFGVDEKDAPLAKLPFSIVSALSAPASPLYTAPAAMSYLRKPRERASRGNTRSQPYANEAASRRRYSGGSNADEEAEEESPRNIPDLFGATPDPSRVPPMPFPDGTIPVLRLGRPSISDSIVPETPTSSPPRRPVPTEVTPPASRTRYGTEFGTTMKNKFSD